jgi:PII-like signaling protein
VIDDRLKLTALLSPSEDLPLVSVVVDTRARIEAVLADVERLRFQGLLTLERARMPIGPNDAVRLTQRADEATKLTVYVRRQQRIASVPAYEAVVALMHRRGCWPGRSSRSNG